MFCFNTVFFSKIFTSHNNSCLLTFVFAAIDIEPYISTLYNCDRRIGPVQGQVKRMPMLTDILYVHTNTSIHWFIFIFLYYD